MANHYTDNERDRLVEAAEQRAFTTLDGLAAEVRKLGLAVKEQRFGPDHRDRALAGKTAGLYVGPFRYRVDCEPENAGRYSRRYGRLRVKLSPFGSWAGRQYPEPAAGFDLPKIAAEVQAVAEAYAHHRAAEDRRDREYERNAAAVKAMEPARKATADALRAAGLGLGLVEVRAFAGGVLVTLESLTPGGAARVLAAVAGLAGGTGAGEDDVETQSEQAP